MGILLKPLALRSSVLYLLISAGIALALTDYAQGSINEVGAWVLAVNFVLICAMGKDKLSAIVNLGRTPEGTLLWLAVAGAFPGLFVARFIFNHKTSKAEFIRPMWILLVLQILAILYYIIIYKPIV